MKYTILVALAFAHIFFLAHASAMNNTTISNATSASATNSLPKNQSLTNNINTTSQNMPYQLTFPAEISSEASQTLHSKASSILSNRISSRKRNAALPNILEVTESISNFTSINKLPVNLQNIFNGTNKIYTENVLIAYAALNSSFQAQNSYNNTNFTYVNIYSSLYGNNATSFASYLPPFIRSPAFSSPNSSVRSIYVKLNKGEGDAVTKIIFHGNTTEYGFNKPIYLSFNISSQINDSNIISAEYNFSVSKQWISNLNLSPYQISLYKYENGKWEQMPTLLTGSNGTYFTYVGISNSFSTYIVSFNQNASVGDLNPESVTLHLGYKLYFCEAGANYTFSTSGSPFSWIQDVGSPSGSPPSGENASIGHQSSNVCSAYTTNSTFPGLAVAGIGVNQTNYILFKNSSSSSSSSNLKYEVAKNNSFVLIMTASGYYGLTGVSIPKGCNVDEFVNNTDTFESAYIATCQGQQEGTYYVNDSLSFLGSSTLAAYVFLPYTLTLDDNIPTGEIETNGATYPSGSTIQVIGTNSVYAIAPANFVFVNWTTSNPVNLSLSNYTSNPAILTVNGNGTLTANFKVQTEFTESGLPSGSRWDVIYDNIFLSSTSPTIKFFTNPGNYTFSIPVQNIAGAAYEPSPSSGYLVSGNSTQINFTPLVANIFVPSNSVVDVGQYETLVANASGGVLPYIYNISISNSTFPSIIINSFVSPKTVLSLFSATFQTTISNLDNSPDSANVVVSDAFPAKAYSQYRRFYVYPALAAPRITSPTLPITLDMGQSLSISASAPSGGTGNFQYIWSVVNGTYCPGFIQQSNTLSFIYSPTSPTSLCEFEITAKDIGTSTPVYVTSNPTSKISVDIYPETTPKGVKFYVPINITNSQPAPTPQQFQQFIQLNLLNYSEYASYNGNTANFEFFYANGTIIPSWIESNSSNIVSIWLKLLTSIPADSKTTIYLGFYNKSSNILSNSGLFGIGEAPQLSLQYGKYDDGQSVFLSYFNGDTSINNFSVSSGYNITQVVGVQMPNGNNGNVLYITGYNRHDSERYISFVYNFGYKIQPSIIESSSELHGNLGTAQGIAAVLNSTSISSASGIGVTMGYGQTYFSQEHENFGSVSVDINPQGSSVSSWIYGSVFFSGASSSSWSGYISPQLYYTNNGYSGNVSFQPIKSGAYLYMSSLGASGQKKYPYNLYINWERSRAIPPNGVMPYVSFSNIFGLSRFIESGLPPNSIWNVTYDNIINYSNTDSIAFSTFPGKYPFSIPNQTVNGITYSPSPEIGYLIAGNITNIIFSKVIACTISLNTSSFSFTGIYPNTSLNTDFAIKDTNDGEFKALILLYGANWLGSMQFGVSNTSWSSSINTPFINSNKLSASLTSTNLYAYPNGTNVYFGINIPGGIPKGNYTQNIYIENSC